MIQTLCLLLFQAAAPELVFRDVTDDMGVDYLELVPSLTLSMGGGCAWFDLDLDGDDDLFTTSMSGQHHLYLNQDGALSEVPIDIEFRVARTMGVIAADHDSDGYPDLYVTNWSANELLRNEGDRTFVDVAPTAGVDDSRWGSSATFADFDLDGDLDLYLGNYIDQLAFPYHIGAPNRLFINDGNARYADHAPLLGVDDTGPFQPLDDPRLTELAGGPPPVGTLTAGCTLSVSSLDWDLDGDADLLVGNDFGMFVRPDRLFENDVGSLGSLAFTDRTEATGFDVRPLYNMGINAADFDHDGDLDFYLSNLGDNVFLLNDGGMLSDVTNTVGPVDGVSESAGLLLTSWSTAWQDFDNDGWEDLLVANGYIAAAPYIANDRKSFNHLWLNRGDGSFDLLDPLQSGMANAGAARGLAVSDFDDDGWLDFYVASNSESDGPDDRYRLFLNEGEGKGWVKLRLKGRSGNTEGLGALLSGRVGDETLLRQVRADPVYLSSHTREVHFGLGNADRMDELTIRWPSGTEQHLLDVPAATRLRLHEPAITIVATRRTATGHQVTLRNHSGRGHRWIASLHGTRTAPVRSGRLAAGAERTVSFPLQGPVAIDATGGLRVRVESDGATDERRL